MPKLIPHTETLLAGLSARAVARETRKFNFSINHNPARRTSSPCATSETLYPPATPLHATFKRLRPAQTHNFGLTLGFTQVISVSSLGGPPATGPTPTNAPGLRTPPPTHLPPLSHFSSEKFPLWHTPSTSSSPRDIARTASGLSVRSLAAWDISFSASTPAPCTPAGRPPTHQTAAFSTCSCGLEVREITGRGGPIQRQYEAGSRMTTGTRQPSSFIALFIDNSFGFSIATPGSSIALARRRLISGLEITQTRTHIEEGIVGQQTRTQQRTRRTQTQDATRPV